MKIPTCLCARLRGGGPEAARRSGQSSTAPAGDRPSTITRALLNGLKVLSWSPLFRSPGYVAELRRKRFRSARRRRANFISRGELGRPPPGPPLARWARVRESIRDPRLSARWARPTWKSTAHRSVLLAPIARSLCNRNARGRAWRVCRSAATSVD